MLAETSNFILVLLNAVVRRKDRFCRVSNVTALAIVASIVEFYFSRKIFYSLILLLEKANTR